MEAARTNKYRQLAGQNRIPLSHVGIMRARKESLPRGNLFQRHVACIKPGALNLERWSAHAQGGVIIYSFIHHISENIGGTRLTCPQFASGSFER